MKNFIFESYGFSPKTKTATFTYSFDGADFFTEEITYKNVADTYDNDALERALFLSFVLVGVSYYKLFPGAGIEWRVGQIDAWQSEFLNKVYQEGMGQFAYENELTRDDLAHFVQTGAGQSPVKYKGEGVLSLQSGGKDSLLTAQLLSEKKIAFDSFYISSSDKYPAILKNIGDSVALAHRKIDIPAINAGREKGGLNGHVPVTFIVMSFALIQGILLNKNKILASIGHEGEEPHDWIGDLAVNHQWSKTWPAEQLFSEYVATYISADMAIGSPLRKYSELRIAELFVEKAWQAYGHSFSSCNLANYMQGADNSELKWCGECPKCANSYLLFAPFLNADELQSIFNGQDLFVKESLTDTFKGLLGIDGIMKPFECVGETEELRLAYHMAQNCGGYSDIGFIVPESSFDYLEEYPSQSTVAL
ncbi:MAG: hypothetical protein HZB75_04205 [Candidatus Saccharibacteria bacterium]|nr:MAG: hypothetical protein HZB75_04205 [Candidatus Saccharibacteria bacterium]